MWVDVEGYPAERLEGWWVNDGHIVGGRDALPRHVAARRSAHVGFAASYCRINGFKVAAFAKVIGKNEGVSAASEECIGPVAAFFCRSKFVGSSDAKPPALEDFLCFGCVSVV